MFFLSLCSYLFLILFLFLFSKRAEVQQQIHRVSGAAYKKCASYKEAVATYEMHGQLGHVEVKGPLP